MTVTFHDDETFKFHKPIVNSHRTSPKLSIDKVFCKAVVEASSYERKAGQQALVSTVKTVKDTNSISKTLVGGFSQVCIKLMFVRICIHCLSLEQDHIHCFVILFDEYEVPSVLSMQSPKDDFHLSRTFYLFSAFGIH